MKAVVVAILGLLLAAGRNSVAQADESAPEGLLPIPQYGGDVWTRSYLTGDWGGTRTDLANKGIQFDVDWTQYVQSVVDGGRDRTTRYGGHLDYLIRLDLMRMGLVPGGLVTIRGETKYGDSVNGAAGPILPVNTAAFFPLTLYSFDQDFARIGNGRLIFQPGQGLVVPNEDETWAVYWSMWQYLFVKGRSDKPIDLSNGVPDRQGLGIFARFGFADRDTNPIEWSGSIGLGAAGSSHLATTTCSAWATSTP